MKTQLQNLFEIEAPAFNNCFYQGLLPAEDVAKGILSHATALKNKGTHDLNIIELNLYLYFVQLYFVKKLGRPCFFSNYDIVSGACCPLIRELDLLEDVLKSNDNLDSLNEDRMDKKDYRLNKLLPFTKGAEKGIVYDDLKYFEGNFYTKYAYTKLVKDIVEFLSGFEMNVLSGEYLMISQSEFGQSVNFDVGNELEVK